MNRLKAIFIFVGLGVGIQLFYSISSVAEMKNFIKKGRIDLLQSYLWVQNSAEYSALCFQAYEIARMRIDQIIKEGDVTKVGVVLDLDETVLSNSLFYKDLFLNPSASWIDWAKKSKAKLIPGSLHFLKYIEKKKIKIFYVTNRPKSLEEATINNLIKLKIPFIRNHLYFKIQKSRSKEERRKIISKNFNIVLYLGDNLGDFSKKFDHLNSRKSAVNKSLFFGKRYIIFPNPLYGAWERALFDKKIYNLKKRLDILRKKSLI